MTDVTDGRCGRPSRMLQLGALLDEEAWKAYDSQGQNERRERWTAKGLGRATRRPRR